MKFFILTEEQAALIRGTYGKYSHLDPLKIYRPKYLYGFKVPFTEVTEYGINVEYADHLDIKDVSGFLKCLPVYNAEYYIKEEDENGNLIRKIYCDGDWLFK